MILTQARVVEGRFAFVPIHEHSVIKQFDFKRYGVTDSSIQLPDQAP